MEKNNPRNGITRLKRWKKRDSYPIPFPNIDGWYAEGEIFRGYLLYSAALAPTPGAIVQLHNSPNM